MTTPAPDDFLHVTLPVLGKRVHRHALACSYGIDDAGIETALRPVEDGGRGLGFVFWTPRQKGERALKAALKRDRESIVLMTGPTTARWGGNVTRYVDKALERLDIEYVDVGMVFWVGVTSGLTEARFEELIKLRDAGTRCSGARQRGAARREPRGPPAGRVERGRGALDARVRPRRARLT